MNDSNVMINNYIYDMCSLGANWCNWRDNRLWLGHAQK